MHFYSGGTHYIRRNSTFLWNGTNNGIAGQFYNWCPVGTTIEVIDWFFPNVIGMTATKTGEYFEVTSNPNNGTESFLIKNPNHSSPTVTNRLNMLGAGNANGQYYPAKWKVVVPVVPGNDGQSSIDVGDLFLIPNGYDEALPPPPEPEIDWDSFHPLDFNQDGTVNILDANIAGQQYGQVVGMMVVRHLGEGNAFDINGDGIVDVNDINSAVQAGAPQHIIQHMTNLALNPPAPTQEYNSEPPVAEDGSAYHPLDGNQDGIVDVLDLVYWAGQPDLSQIAKAIICNMVQRYIDGICPYDVTQDGQVSILDITHCSQNGIPEKILQDIVVNVGSEVPMPQIPEP